MIFIKQLVILIAGLALIWLVILNLSKPLNAPEWFIALLCGVIGGITIVVIEELGES